MFLALRSNPSRFLYDGSKLVERLIVVSEHNLEKFNRDYVYPLNDSLVVS